MVYVVTSTVFCDTVAWVDTVAMVAIPAIVIRTNAKQETANRLGSSTIQSIADILKTGNRK